FILLGLIVAISGNRKLLLTYLILTVMGGGAAMYDFYKWGYDYGHNLDPKAAIQIPGLSYQPPLFGHKTLLNFDAYSYPDSGGWVIIGVGITFVLVWLYEWRRSSKQKVKVKTVPVNPIPAIAAIAIISLSSCSVKPEPFNYGKDICADCSMAIMDPKFGGEVITEKGKIYKFDDAYCVLKFIKSNKVKPADIAQTVFIDYENDKNFLDVESLFFVVSPQLKSPMNSNAAAFSNQQKADKIASETAGEVKTWKQLKEQ
ncbi:MAG: nitrous oxide reductase accessory protein NosL, partial [Flavisolibacter sp.]